MTAFSGIRVLDFSSGIAGPMATMLLGDFHAEVIKVEPPGGDPWRDDPGYLCWNRNKRRITVDLHSYEGLRDARKLIASADVAVFDHTPGELERLGLDGGTLTQANPRLLHAWLPAYGTKGRWTHLPPGDALLSAVTSGCFMQFSWEDVPVHLVTPQISYAQGITGSLAIASALHERHRSGRGQPLIVSGLHAFAFIESGAALRAGELLRMRMPGARGGMPNYRLYQCSDGQWLFLATLMQAHFLKALEVMDLFEVMTMDGVDGEFTNILLPENNTRVIARLDERFAERPRQEWLDLLHEAGVPSGPVLSREEWYASEAVAANGMRRRFNHPELGAVDMPGVPVKLHDTPGDIRAFMRDASLDDVLPSAEVSSEPPAADMPPASPGGPLAGVRVLDLGMIIAGTHCATALANYGADVLKVEPPDGDSFRPYGLGFVGLTRANAASRLI